MTDRPIRVLQVFGKMNRGGAATYIMNLYREVNRKLIQFDFVVHTKDKCDYDSEILKLGGNIYHAPHYKGVNFFEYQKWWKSFFHDHDEYRIIHGHIRSTANIYLRIAKEFGLTTIIHSHSTSNGKGFLSIVKNHNQKMAIQYSDYLVACSQMAGKWMYRDNDFVVFNNGINLESLSFDITVRNNYRKNLGIENSLVFGHVGRFHEAKNHVFLLDVFEKLHNADNMSRLLLVGDGPLRQRIEDIISNKKLKDSVILTGVRSDIPGMLMAMDVFLFPSKWEGFPVSLIEAQAVGMPCFVSDTVTAEAIIAENAFQLPITDAAYWANNIKAMSSFKHIDSTDAIRTAGYDIKDEAKKIEEFYFSLL